jgi:rhodanese-related sulfurtransferase
MRRIQSLLPAFILISMTTAAQHPFKYDHTVYKTAYLNEAFRLMDSMQNFLLLDVRSPGEYADTSKATFRDIGRIRGSVNISIDSVPGHLAALKKYINQPVFVYCSHSQRSRRVSKLLAENGFKNVYNINGGMTVVNESGIASFPYKNKVLLTNLNYTNIASTDAYELIKTTPDLVIIDIRTEQEFASGDSVQANNIGRLKNAINIPQGIFAEKIDSWHIPKTSPILLYDLHGYNSMDVVDILREKGYSRIYNLYEGLEIFINDHHLKNLVSPLIAEAPAFHMIDTKSGIDLLNSQPRLVILDTRPLAEFTNTAELSYKNLGHIKNAIHIPSLDSLEFGIQQKNKSDVFMVYGSGGDLSTLVCQALIKKGFTNVYLLNRGLYDFVWSVANIEDCSTGKEFLTDHDGLY